MYELGFDPNFRFYLTVFKRERMRPIPNRATISESGVKLGLGRPIAPLGKSAPLALVGAALIILLLMRGAFGISVWLAAVLPALAGAGTVGNYRRKQEREIHLNHYVVGAYVALALAVGVAMVVNSRFAAAVLGLGVWGAIASAMVVAGMKGRTVHLAVDLEQPKLPPAVRQNDDRSPS